ncbi:MAG: IS110 family transposase, partial [Acidobacteriota bacterium]|nr:IS110 family transposase [Acidobacteriota bacterium]
MDYIGIDLHKNSSQVCVLTDDGELIERRIKTDKESFDKLFADTPPARILVEASTDSEWAARQLEALGHEVVVADPNFAPMYATRDRRIKTDRRDARALCEACRLGAYRPAHHTSDRQRDVRAHLAVRETLVRTRSKYISLIGALARREGCRIEAGPSPSFARRVEAAGLPAHTLAQVEPLLLMLKALNEQIKAADKRLEEIAKADEVVQRLCSVPGVGPVVAMTFAATLDDASRFLGAKHVRSYLGLRPGTPDAGTGRRDRRHGRGGHGRTGRPRRRRTREARHRR